MNNTKEIQIKPFVVNILVTPAKAPSAYATDGEGIICLYGIVKDIGDEVKNVKIGDTIGFVKHGLLNLEIDDKVYYFIPETDDFLLAKFIY
jgi:co-chaperonin GroES (HSP10)